MKNIRLTKIFSFETAHALYRYDGKCKNIHGHSYRLQVTISGKVNENEKDAKFGMLYDFGDLKRLVQKEITEPFDHATILNRESGHRELGEFLQKEGHKIIFTSYQPTCENMLFDFSQKIKQQLPKEIKLHSLRLYETENSYAEWFAEDNLL